MTSAVQSQTTEGGTQPMRSWDGVELGLPQAEDPMAASTRPSWRKVSLCTLGAILAGLVVCAVYVSSTGVASHGLMNRLGRSTAEGKGGSTDERIPLVGKTKATSPCDACNGCIRNDRCYDGTAASAANCADNDGIWCRKEEAPFQIGDHVQWTTFDKDVPEGTVGEVIGYAIETARVSVRFPNGIFRFKPEQLHKAELHEGDKVEYSRDGQKWKRGKVTKVHPLTVKGDGNWFAREYPYVKKAPAISAGDMVAVIAQFTSDSNQKTPIMKGWKGRVHKIRDDGGLDLDFAECPKAYVIAAAKDFDKLEFSKAAGIGDTVEFLHDSIRVTGTVTSVSNWGGYGITVANGKKVDYVKMASVTVVAKAIYRCPDGHRLERVKVGKLTSGFDSHICDICRVSTRGSGDTEVLRCGQCNYDKCISCCKKATCSSYMCQTRGQVKKSGVDDLTNPSDAKCCESQQSVHL